MTASRMVSGWMGLAFRLWGETGCDDAYGSDTASNKYTQFQGIRSARREGKRPGDEHTGTVAVTASEEPRPSSSSFRSSLR